jgi:hypothetical protein
MNARLQPSYTNSVSPEYLRGLDKPHFTEQRIAQFSEQARAVVCLGQAYIDTHPAIAIFRCATEGSQTRDGGVIQQGTGLLEFNLEDGRSVRAARKGDYVLYAGGTTAQIITGAGQDNNDVALVGSVLSNGDEIINTLQGGFLFIAREGVSAAEDFLPCIAD